MTHTDIYNELNRLISNGVDVYSIARKNKLLQQGITKAYYVVRPGIVLGLLADDIESKPELLSLFKK